MNSFLLQYFIFITYFMGCEKVKYMYILGGLRPLRAPRARQPPTISPEVVVPRIVIPPPLYLLPQEGYTILRALLYSSLNMIRKFYYHLHTTMK